MDKILLLEILSNYNQEVRNIDFSIGDDETVSNIYCDLYTLLKRKESWSNGNFINVSAEISRMNLKSYPKNLWFPIKKACNLLKLSYKD
jgi:hypothetical protein